MSREVKEYERQIDQMYKLYDLTLEELKIEEDFSKE